LTGEFNVCGDCFLLVFEGPPNEHQESLFLSWLVEVWDRIPLIARQAILAKSKKPSIKLSNRLTDYRPMVVSGRKGRVPWPVAEGGPNGFLFSCDRMRIFGMPKPWALILVGEELAHAYLIAVNHPSHAKPPSSDDASFAEYDVAREAKMLDVLCDEWGFDRTEYGRMQEWMKQSDSGLKTNFAPEPEKVSGPVLR